MTSDYSWNVGGWLRNETSFLGTGEASQEPQGRQLGVVWQFMDRMSLRLCQRARGRALTTISSNCHSPRPAGLILSLEVRCLSKPSKVFAHLQWGDSRTGKKSQSESQTVPPGGALSRHLVRKTSLDQNKGDEENAVF